ncbi:hypothetical protein ACQUSR_20695 [Streptomyces sp. P1-3]|uniref:hypothetical protein n=1 Tax=unclassified Streptomyces TaxID=2593676 RepID=UPI0026F42774|nr:hypothetical protein [Streptomyces sp. XD-27]WKX70698.1 hypothetical protein Q3Y56_12980 [Streptomyces sp. XD-27]
MSTNPRLLPWAGPAGQPAYLVTDGGRDSHLWRLADEMEAVQLRMGTEMVRHARAMVEDRKAGPGELRFLANRLTEALTDALRVAESRGMRLAMPDASSGEEGQAS